MAIADPKIYNPKMCKMAFGNHMASGYGEDTFISIEEHGDGVEEVVGADGSENISISPDDMQTITATFLQNSETNAFLNNMYKKMKQDGTGFFPILIRDMMGGEQYAATWACVKKSATWVRAKGLQAREWTIIAHGEIKEF